MKKDLTLEKQSTTKGFAILSAAGLIIKVISVLYLPFLTIILGEASMGIYAYVYSIYQWLYIITNSGLPSSISKIVSELIATGNYKDAVKSFKISRNLLIIFGLITTLLMFFLAGPITKFMNFPKAAFAVKVLSPALLITGILSAYRGYFQGKGNMSPTALSQVIEHIINVTFSLGCAYFLIKYGIEKGIAGATIGTTLGALIAVVLLIIIYKRHKPAKRNDINNKYFVKYTSRDLLKKILNYSIPMTVCLGLQSAGLLIDAPIVKSRLLYSGFSESVANSLWAWFGSWYTSLINVPIAIIMSLAVAVLPSISELAAVKDNKALENKINYAFRLCFMIAIPAAFGLMSLSGGIYKLFGYNIQAAELMKYGALILILLAILQIQTSILQGIGKIYIVTFYAIIGLIAKVIVNYFLVAVPSINIRGALIGNAVCYIIPVVLNYITINKALKVRIGLFKHSFKPLFASVVMGISAYLLHYVITTLIGNGYLINAVAVLLSISLAVFVYMYSLIIIAGIRKRDLDTLPSKITRRIPKFMLNDMDE
jgi:stage V sporulation protein B